MPLCPAARSSGVLCIERAPISNASTWPRSTSMSSAASGSAITGNPVTRRASSSSGKPAMPEALERSRAVCVA